MAASDIVTEVVIDHLKTAIAENRLELGLAAYQIQGPASASALMPNMKYVTTKMATGQEVIFTGIRRGKRSEFIFEFEPVDAQEWKQVEFTDKTVFDFVQDFEEPLIKAMMPLMFPNHDKGGVAPSSFKNAVHLVARNINEQDRETARIESRRLAAQKIEEAGAYEANPLYGMF